MTKLPLTEFEKHKGRIYPPPDLPNCRECPCLASCIASLGDYPTFYIKIRPLAAQCSELLEYLTIEKKVTRMKINGGDYTRHEISFMRITDICEQFDEIRSEYHGRD